VAGKKAMEDGGIGLGSAGYDAVDKLRCGILVGSAFGGMQTFATAVEALETQGA
jgi:3-oxoacyl-[acyl-carrier-protein] synthase II